MSRKKEHYDKSVYRSLTLIMQFGINMLVPICVTAALSVILGIFPNFGPHLYDLASMAAEAITVGWTGGGW